MSQNKDLTSRHNYMTIDGRNYATVVGKAWNGTSMTEEKAKLERWKQNFEKILNRPVPPDLANITEAKEDLDINLDPITIDEIIAAIRKLKNNKAPGEDGVCAEMQKATENVTPKILHKIFQDIWETEDIPQSWKKGLIVKLPKNGDLGD